MTCKNIMDDIDRSFNKALDHDFKECEQRAYEEYAPSAICAMSIAANSCSHKDILIDCDSIAQEISHKPLRLNKKDADPYIVAQVVALYTALRLASQGCHITDIKEGLLIHMYQKPETLYLSTADIKARISKMRVEYVQ